MMLSSAPKRIRPAQTHTSSGLEGADVALATRLASRKDHPLVRALAVLGELGDQPQLAAIGGAVLVCGIMRRDRRLTEAGAGMLGSLLLATLVTGGIKRLVSRTRPHVLLDEGHYEVKWLTRSEGPSRSFPSGHTAGSIAVARAVGRAYPGVRRPAYSAAAFVALTQLPRGAHYPLDIVAGAFIGIGVESAVGQLTIILSDIRQIDGSSACARG